MNPAYNKRMRYFRPQLINLLDQARQQHRLETMPPRLVAALTHDFLTLLPTDRDTRITMHSRTISHGSLHRHVITIRCPDQAFYLDAIKGYLIRVGIQPIGQQTMVARMRCDENFCNLELTAPDTNDEDNFMFIALHISATLTPEREPLHKDIQAILQAVDLSVRDFEPMRRLVASCSMRLMPDDPDAATLLEWMNDNRYLYFGMESDGKRLGILNNKRVCNRVVPHLGKEIAACSPPAKPGLTWLSLTASQHYLYSPTSIEVVRICWRGSNNELEQAIIIGHFSRSARFANASHLPILSGYWHKLAANPLLQHSAFYRREIRTLFDRMPNRMLLGTDASAWLEPLREIIDLADPKQSIAHWMPCHEGNMDTLLIAFAVERYGPKVMERIMQNIGAKNIRIHGHDSFGVGTHRIILISISKPDSPIDTQLLNRLVQHCIVFWRDIALADVMHQADTLNIPAALRELQDLPPLYQDLFPPAQFARDLIMRDLVLASKRMRVRIHPKEADIDVRIYSRQQPSLGNLVDTLRAFGLDPVQEWLVPFGRQVDEESGEPDERIYISTLTCRPPRPMTREDNERLRRALALILNQKSDHDPVNALLILAELDINDIAILITLRNHLIQLLPDAALMPLSNMLIRHPAVAACLVRLFAAHHSLGGTANALADARDALQKAMQAVETLTDDRWFRALTELAEASLRTNAFIRQPGSPLAIKIDPGKLGFAPHPVPYREIFMHGTHIEGVHLRAGPIARGGLRYSDRPSDFRTEVLELMSTQTVKNGQIIPTGSKGGFVVRDEASSKTKGGMFVLEQYRIYVRTLLELTDNLVQGQALPPDGIRIPEDDMNDPYLVVAADKGTARFSDDANEESRLAGFWLDDAFASGGKHGYDHKAVGITARGAWVCAAHHFARLGRNAYKDDLTCTGIGDMAGDVFGNGMLLNPNLKLLAAFNHRHIFLDPEPDTEKAFSERQRLFREVAGWDSYDHACISVGGGIFSRTAKSIPLSAAVQTALGIDAKSLSGEALIRAILCAPVDLLYNGGIGTYVKASHESHVDVRDPVNNAVRVNACDLRCRVVSEGGNLGFTQEARIEYAHAGGAINTDAMDNSGGVDMSDHEVNLKILFTSLTHAGTTGAQRNRILKNLTNAVTDQCLQDNVFQSRVLTLAELDAQEYPPRLQRLRDTLALENWLDEAVAPQINDNALLALRPQLSILVGQEKNRIHALLAEVKYDQWTTFGKTLLHDYFPHALHKHYKEEFAAHALANEIIYTQAANHVVNHMGLGAVHHLQTLLDNSAAEMVEALLIAETMLDAASLRESIWLEVADIEIAARMHRGLQEGILRFAEEVLRLCKIEELTCEWITEQQKGLHHFRKSLAAQGIGGMENSRYLSLLKTIAQIGLPTSDAAHLAAMPELAHAACAVHLASSMKRPLSECLQASQACLHVLPIEQMEEPLRSPEWGGEDAHSLRREWLHRLALLKERAIRQLLAQDSKEYIRIGEELWCQHPHWSELESFGIPPEETDAEHAESRRMRLMLALTRLEAIVNHT